MYGLKGQEVCKDEFVELFNAHSEAFGLRGEYYAGMRLFPADGEGFAKTIVWEAAKQAVRSALDDPTANLPIVMSTSVAFGAALNELAIGLGMKRLAAPFHDEAAARLR